MTTVHFQMSQTFQPAAAAIVAQIVPLVQPIAADADVQDIGATAIPGLLTKGGSERIRTRIGDHDHDHVARRHLSVLRAGRRAD